MNTEYKPEIRLKRVLETISDDVLDMVDFWKEESTHNLVDRLKFVNDALFNCKLENTTLSWNDMLQPERVVLPVMPFMLLYDTCLTKDLVHRNHPDDSYDITEAFDNGVFIGWEVRFFQSMQEVEGYIKGYSSHNYFLYFNGKKVLFKYGVYIDHHINYTDAYTFYNQLNTADCFIEVPDLFKLTYNDKSVYFLCHNQVELLHAAMGISNTTIFSPEQSQQEILVETRHRQYKGELFKVNNEFSLLFDVKDYNYIDLFADPFNPYSVGCYSACKTFDKFIRGERVSKEEICKDKGCPIDDLFNRYLKFTDSDKYKNLCEEESVDDLISKGSLCSFCDFKDLTRFEEPCYHCNEGMQQQMLRQGQIRFTEEKQ